MTRPTVRRRLLSLALAAALSGPLYAQNFDAFMVSDIRVEGLQRISAGTVFSYLPVEKGDMLDRGKSAEAIRALYKTGFFSDVKLDRQGDILVVTVAERPAIDKVTLVGNKDIKTEDLMKGLKNVGLSEGETFNPLNLDHVTQELLRQYNNRGKYNVAIDPAISPLDRNRVDVVITIKEGKASRIRDINIVGNEKFTDTELRQSWESGTSNWLSWYRRDDQYSREKLSGDLEKLSNYYLDRGYVDFNVESTQVAISPDKKDMFITASVTEGEVYTVTDVKVSGDTILPQDQVEKMVLVKSGQIFSRQRLELTSDAITAVLGNIGYAFAKVTPIPEVDRAKRTVGINFFVEPGPRVQVRRITFKGNVHTADAVIRREMRQFEGAWYSQAALDRSKIRLQRLGYFETVDIDTPEVAGAPDQVDVVVNVKERNSGSFVFGLGYSQLAGLITSIQLEQNNFLGTGNRFNLAVQNNTYSKRFNFAYTNPYFTDDGLSVGYNLSYSDYDTGGSNNFAHYSSKSAAGEALFGIPITETDSLSASLGIDRNQLTTGDTSTPKQLIQYLVDTLGDRERFPAFQQDDDNNPDTPKNNDDGDPTTIDTPIRGVSRLWTINAWRISAGWAHDSRNDYLLPTRGMYHRFNAEIVLPGSDLQYYRLNYDFEYYKPLTSWLVMKVGLGLGYGDSYGKTSTVACKVFDTADVDTGTTRSCGLPFFKNFYAGGPQSVRGFTANSLGPYVQLNATVNPNAVRQPIGGAVKTVGTFEFFFPTLFDARGTRLSTFIDYGNVFASSNDFSVNRLRVSAGVALQWQSPMGPIAISYALPIRKDPRDEIERLQFTFGQTY